MPFSSVPDSKLVGVICFVTSECLSGGHVRSLQRKQHRGSEPSPQFFFPFFFLKMSPGFGVNGDSSHGLNVFLPFFKAIATGQLLDQLVPHGREQTAVSQKECKNLLKMSPQVGLEKAPQNTPKAFVPGAWAIGFTWEILKWLLFVYSLISFIHKHNVILATLLSLSCLFIFYESGCFVWMYAYLSCADLPGTHRVQRSHETVVTDGNKLPCGCWKMNPGLLQE